jgi:hypothetical protein
LPILVGGVSISGGDVVRAASILEALRDALSPTQAPVRASAQEQKPGNLRVHHRHRLVHRSKPPTPDTAFAKARPSKLVSTRTVTTSEGEEVLKPHRVSTVSVLPEPAHANTLEEMVALPADDDVKMPSILSVVQRSSAPATGIELMVLLSTCAGAAMGVYGLVAIGSRRRASRVSPPAGCSRTGAPPSTHRYGSRARRRRLVAHQLGISFPGGDRL